MERCYFNVICEEISILGGKVIHIDENVGSLEEVHKKLDSLSNDELRKILDDYKLSSTANFKEV